jgi:hypothetical protein
MLTLGKNGLMKNFAGHNRIAVAKVSMRFIMVMSRNCWYTKLNGPIIISIITSYRLNGLCRTLLRKSNDYNSDNKFATELLRCCGTVLLSQSRLQSRGYTYPSAAQMCNQQRGLAPIARGFNPQSPGNSHTGFRVSHFSFPRSHASPLSSHPSLLLLLTGVGGVTPGKIFEIMPASGRVLAHFGRKNPVFDESTKSYPSFG